MTQQWFCCWSKALWHNNSNTAEVKLGDIALVLLLKWNSMTQQWFYCWSGALWQNNDTTAEVTLVVRTMVLLLRWSSVTKRWFYYWGGALWQNSGSATEVELYKKKKNGTTAEVKSDNRTMVPLLKWSLITKQWYHCWSRALSQLGQWFPTAEVELDNKTMVPLLKWSYIMVPHCWSGSR